METVTRPTPNCAFVYPATGEQCDIPKATHERKVKNHEFVAPAPQKTPAQQAHTPLPWYYKQPTPFSGCDIYGQEVNGYVATTSGRAKANAELIVKCVNRDPAFQKLVEVARLASKRFNVYGDLNDAAIRDAAREALRLAREGEE